MKLRAAFAFVVVGAFALSGCTGAEKLPEPAEPGRVDRVAGGGEARLVTFDSCETALRELRSAAGAEPLPPSGDGDAGTSDDSGRSGGVSGNEGDPGAGDANAVPAQPQAPQGAPGIEEREAPSPVPEEHSGTNNHEAGVEEPDLAYTDGSRIVTVAGGSLRVADVATRTVTSTVEIPGGSASNLLVDGDRALVVGDQAELTLVDLSASATVLGTLRTDGGYVDARLVDGTARVVVSSVPAVAEPARAPSSGGIGSTGGVGSIDDWLPRYELARPDGTTSSGRLVDCERLSHPETYRPTSILSVLTIDLAGELGTGDPVAIAAGGATVYGTADSLYIANPAGGDTEIFRFDITGEGPAKHVASGKVEGELLNQYAMSEHEDVLRVATTRSGSTGSSDSAVSVLAKEGDALRLIGELEGLGPGERIYAVRFFGPVGYVVTFRETDPLYTLDLRDPGAPKAAGELKITGYSAYLHNAGDGRLIGVGQEADERGRVLGVQVSLFDVSHAAQPRRLAQHRLSGGMALVEQDTHAFLYWEPERMLLLPTDTGVLVLRVSDANVTELGKLGEGESVSRTLIIGDDIWTVGESGLAVYDVDGLAKLADLPF
ncbi:beta-propeller domain-containing protein [Saccharomonospora sp. NPDC006951]